MNTNETPSPNPGASTGQANVDPAEVSRFAALAQRWWDPNGEFRPLHQIGPTRLAFIRTAATEALNLPVQGLRPLTGLNLLDIGSGGGLVSEPLARMGANVTGIDLADETVEAARAHAAAGGLDIDYRVQSIEDLAASGQRFDVALCLEVVEHVPDPASFLATAAKVVTPGGLLIASTLSRTLKSYALAILGAEYLLRWVPAGTHQWDRFLTPEELSGHMASAGLTSLKTAGIVYNPLTGRWSLSDDTDVNYMIAARKP